MEDRTQVLNSSVRRCHECGSEVPGRRCPDCGAKIEPRLQIGLLAGVGQNFGVVNNVYNIVQPEPDLEPVDVFAVQDGLNAQYPERVQPVLAQEPATPQLGPSKAVKAINFLTYVFTAVALAGMVAAYYLVTRF